MFSFIGLYPWISSIVMFRLPTLCDMNSIYRHAIPKPCRDQSLYIMDNGICICAFIQKLVPRWEKWILVVIPETRSAIFVIHVSTRNRVEAFLRQTQLLNISIWNLFQCQMVHYKTSVQSYKCDTNKSHKPRSLEPCFGNRMSGLSRRKDMHSSYYINLMTGVSKVLQRH